MSTDLTQELQERVRAALADATPLRLLGNDTKSFIGRAGGGEPLGLSGHTGLISYQPTELVVTARCGTTLAELKAALAEQGQMLPFEPPHFAGPDGQGATLGGTIACGLSGPARPYWGAARDLVLGARVLTGRGEVLRFGGEVMKNVAGYDVSRLMVGALGTLGILLDVSLKVLPIPAATRTRALSCNEGEALERMTRWGARPWPLSATCFDGERLWVRLSGTAQGVAEAAEQIGGEPVADDEAEVFWQRLREQEFAFFSQGESPLWRLSLPQGAPAVRLEGAQWIEWSGSQRWLRSEASESTIRAEAERLGGQATCFRGGDRTGEVFHPLPEPLMQLHRRVKSAFDPHGLLNPGRLYANL
ncbi:glycolate oxidase subunit GlcE [Allochromatium vinosum]|uniref:FAD linked oxidase domain protein n=1 Tax=Allochromatium vinosum (strain ATCC 17899 / DSM 180 / NBRC 103801 / NCIMB 10441 / D) TaxID=572477 RepID=D3RVJ9_ALLVD|nr:glycolate oxidase subunit GlcE [Allochromatium vinosum]ADC61126.1 FAD linked oxidase domain protein [Allochromatium vinosum DSM 180]